MGSGESSRSAPKNGNNPNRSVPNRQAVPGPGSGYNYYRNPYMPQQYGYPIRPGYPMYPGYYNGYNPTYGGEYYGNGPVVSNTDYLNHQMNLRTQNKSNVPEHSTHHHHVQHSNNINSHSQSHHHHHSPRSHHHSHHHHQHRQTPLLTENERISPPVRVESTISRRPSVPRAPTVTITKISSPTKQRENLSPPIPPPFVQVQQPATVSATPKVVSPPSPVQRSAAVQSSKPPTFEKAPIIETNYVLKSADNNTIQSYRPDTLSIVRRSGAPPGNRWYDHDYDKRVKTIDDNFK